MGFPWRSLHFFWFLLLGFEALADSDDRLCRILNYACKTGGSSTTGTTYPASSDAFSNNPASIPTEKTPFGVEALLGQGETNYGFFQGYGKFGMAAGSIAKENAFFSNASNLAAIGVELPQGTGGDINKSNYQLGFAVPLFKNSLKRWFVPVLGFSGRRYKQSENIREGYGLSLTHKYLHLGVGLAKNDENVGVLSRSGGFKWKRFSFDYTYIENLKGISNKTKIYSMIYMFTKVTLIGAYRLQEIQALSLWEQELIRLQGKSIQEAHLFLGIQYQLGRVFAIGYYINYVLEKGPYFGLRMTLGSF